MAPVRALCDSHVQGLPVARLSAVGCLSAMSDDEHAAAARRRRRRKDGPSTYMDRLVAREIEAMRRQGDEEAREAYRLRTAADGLRAAAEALLDAADARAEERDASRGGGAVRFGVPEGAALVARRMTAAEMGQAFAWMRRDQHSSATCVRFWDKAAESIMGLFEADGSVTPGEPPPTQRLFGYFERGAGKGAAPLGFAACKDDGVSVDVMGVRLAARGRGVGRAIAEHLIELANARAKRLADQGRREDAPRRYVLDSIPAALPFWRALGFTAMAEEEVDVEDRVMGKLRCEIGSGQPKPYARCLPTSLNLTYTSVFSGDTRLCKDMLWWQE